MEVCTVLWGYYWGTFVLRFRMNNNRPRRRPLYGPFTPNRNEYRMERYISQLSHTEYHYDLTCYVCRGFWENWKKTIVYKFTSLRLIWITQIVNMQKRAKNRTFFECLHKLRFTQKPNFYHILLIIKLQRFLKKQYY